MMFRQQHILLRIIAWFFLATATEWLTAQPAPGAKPWDSFEIWLETAENTLDTDPGASLQLANKLIEQARTGSLPRDPAQRLLIWNQEARANLVAGKALMALGDKKRALRYFRTAKIMADQAQDEILSSHAQTEILALGKKPGFEQVLTGFAEAWNSNVGAWVRETEINVTLEQKSREVAILSQMVLARELEKRDPAQAKELYQFALPRAIAYGDSSRAQEIRKRLNYLETGAEGKVAAVSPAQPPPHMAPPPAPEPAHHDGATANEDAHPRGSSSAYRFYRAPSSSPYPSGPGPRQPVPGAPSARPGAELLQRSESLEKTGDYKASLEALKAYQGLQEAYDQLLLRQEIDSAANELTLQSKIQEIELLREIQSLNEESNARERLLLIAILTGAFAVAGVMALLFFSKRKSHLTIKKAYDDLDHAHRRLQSAQTQLVASEKMASLGQLTAGIAHEINNPVNFISGNIGPLRQDLEDVLDLVDAYREAVVAAGLEAYFAVPSQKADTIDLEYLKEEMHALLKGVEEGANRTTEIVKGLRNFARMDEDDLKFFDLRSGIDSTLVLLRNKCENIEIRRQYADLPDIEGLPGKLNQVFMNLLVNAIQSIRQKERALGAQGGAITIATELSEDQQWARIRISDTGVGIPEHIRDKIFDPFFTTKEVGEGTGLGLSISLGIVRQHEGRIEVTSSSGSGTSMCVSLPVAYRGKLMKKDALQSV